MNLATHITPTQHRDIGRTEPRQQARRYRSNVVHLGPSPTFKALVFCLGWAGALLVWVGRMAGLV